MTSDLHGDTFVGVAIPDKSQFASGRGGRAGGERECGKQRDDCEAADVD
jgi:hypothetical protein